MRFVVLAVALTLAIPALAEPEVSGPYYRVTCDGAPAEYVKNPSEVDCLEECGWYGFSALEPGSPCFSKTGKRIPREKSPVEIKASPEDVRSSCARLFPDAFELQLACVEDNIRDRTALVAGLGKVSYPDVLTAARTCLEMFATPEKAGFTLARSCANQEIEAINALREMSPGGIP